MPGLIDDAHASRSGLRRALGRIWLAYGVTSVRNPSQNPYIGTRDARAFDIGRRVGAARVLSGQAFDGSARLYPGGIVDRVAAASRSRSSPRVKARRRFLQDIRPAAGSPQQTVTELCPRGAHCRSPRTSCIRRAAFGVDGVEHLRGTSRRGYSPKVSATNRSYQDVDRHDRRRRHHADADDRHPGRLRRSARSTTRRCRRSRGLTLFPLPTAVALVRLSRERPRTAGWRPRSKPYDVNRAERSSSSGRHDRRRHRLAARAVRVQPACGAADLRRRRATPFQALQTATINAARALGVDDQLGTIEAGKLADLAFVGGDPLVDIRNARDVRRVMRSGRLYTVEDLLPDARRAAPHDSRALRCQRRSSATLRC